MDWIQGNKFQAIADYTYAPKDRYETDYAQFKNTLDINLLKDNDIIYVQGFARYKRELLNLLTKTKKKVILISHNCDDPVDGSYKILSNVIRWYAENVNVNNPKIEAIPWGVENDTRFPELRKKDKMIQKLKEVKNIRNLVYMNHNIENNQKERAKPYKLFEDKKWVTTEHGKHGDSFDPYLDNLYNHYFMISPEGNGIDTIRLWECLYMRTIPIEKRNLNNNFFTDLPICFVNDWEEVTEEFLIREWWRINTNHWNREMLTFEYWKNKILCTAGRC